VWKQVFRDTFVRKDEIKCLISFEWLDLELQKYSFRFFKFHFIIEKIEHFASWGQQGQIWLLYVANLIIITRLKSQIDGNFIMNMTSYIEPHAFQSNLFSTEKTFVFSLAFFSGHRDVCGHHEIDFVGKSFC